MGEYCNLYPDTGKSVGLTPTGVTIWRALLNRKGLNGIIDELGDEFEPLPENIQEEGGRIVSIFSRESQRVMNLVETGIPPRSLWRRYRLLL